MTTTRTIFEQPDEASAREQCDRVIDGLRPRFSAVAALLADAEADLLTHTPGAGTERVQIPALQMSEWPTAAVSGEQNRMRA